MLILGPRGPLLLLLVDPRVRQRKISVKEYILLSESLINRNRIAREGKNVPFFGGSEEIVFFIFLSYVGPSVAVLIHPGR